MRLLADEIRGGSRESIGVTGTSPQHSANPRKLLKSAINNWEQKNEARVLLILHWWLKRFLLMVRSIKRMLPAPQDRIPCEKAQQPRYIDR